MKVFSSSIRHGPSVLECAARGVAVCGSGAAGAGGALVGERQAVWPQERLPEAQRAGGELSGKSLIKSLVHMIQDVSSQYIYIIITYYIGNNKCI